MRTPLHLAFAALLLSPSAALAQAYPVTVTDDRGVAVTFESKPERVAALSILGADVLNALGECQVGITTYEGRFPAYLPSCDNVTDYGDIATPNLELMAQDKIDLAVGMLQYAAPFATEIEAMGGKLLAYKRSTLEESDRSIESITTALGEADKGWELNDGFRALIAEYEAKAPGGKSALFVWAYYDTLYGYQTNQLPAELLPNLKVTNALGRADVADPSQAFVPIEAEDLLKLDPDVLFIYVSHGEQGKDNPVYAQLRSVKEGHAYFVGAHYSQPTGPIARELVFREMAHLIYPDTFAAPEQGEGVASVVITP